MINCNICDCEQTVPLLQKNGYTVHQCTNCQLAFTYPLPEALDDQYDEQYFELYGKHWEFRIKRAQKRLGVIEMIRQKGRLLDVGCSLGYFVQAAESCGWDAEGLEISPFASALARKNGLNVKTGTLKDAGYPDASFDCVTMWDVIEHVPDPTAQMQEINRILTPGGVAVIGTPNLAHALFKIKRTNWRHLKPAEHIFYFQASNLNRLLERTGFVSVNPLQCPGRSSASARTIACELMTQLINPRDVVTVYGVKK